MRQRWRRRPDNSVCILWAFVLGYGLFLLEMWNADGTLFHRQATQEPSQDCARYGEDKRSNEERQEVEDWSFRWDVETAIMFVHPV